MKNLRVARAKLTPKIFFYFFSQILSLLQLLLLLSQANVVESYRGTQSTKGKFLNHYIFLIPERQLNKSQV